MLDRRRFVTSAGVAAAGLLLPDLSEARGFLRGDCNRITLPSGRRLGFAVYGNPNPERATTILYFHGMPTSRLEARLFHEEAAEEMCRIISVDRPGAGLSDFKCTRTILQWPEDVRELLKVLGPGGQKLEAFSVMGVSSGGPYAAACALKLKAEGLKSVAIVSGVGPVTADVDGGKAARYFALVSRYPRMAGLVMATIRRRVRRRPDKAVRRISALMSEPDSVFLCNPVYRDTFVNAFLEAVRCGNVGIVRDMSLLARSWGFLPDEIDASIGLWYGDCDVTTPAAIGHDLGRRLPNAELRVFPGEGHISLLKGDPVKEILRSLKNVGGQSAVSD